MRFSLLSFFIVFSAMMILSCGGKEPRNAETSPETKPTEESSSELNFLAGFSDFTAPADGAVLREISTVIKLNPYKKGQFVKQADLLVNGQKVGSTSLAEAWQLSWPNYYWSDGQTYALKVRYSTDGGNEVLALKTVNVTSPIEVAQRLDGLVQLDQQVFEGLSELDVTLPLLPAAKEYQVEIDGPSGITKLASTGLQFKIPLPEFGFYQVRYRAVTEIEGLTLEGPFSPTSQFEFKPLQAPVVEAMVIEGDGEFKLTLEWEVQDSSSQYRAVLISKETGEELASQANLSGSVAFDKLEPGIYEWQVVRERGDESVGVSGQITPGVSKESVGGQGIFGWPLAKDCSEASQPDYSPYAFFKNNTEGEWDFYRNCMIGRGENARTLSSVSAKDFFFGGIITLLSGQKASLLFRLQDDEAKSLELVLNAETNSLGLWQRSAEDVLLSSAPASSIAVGKANKVGIKAIANEIQVWLNDTLVISYLDETFSQSSFGRFGLATNQSVIKIDGLYFLSFLSGSWSLLPDGLFAYHPNWDGFALSNYHASNFAYSADITVDKRHSGRVKDGRALGMVFRAQYTETDYLVDGYVLSFDVGADLVKLWSPSGFDKTVGNLGLQHDKSYRLNVVANKTHIQVFIDGTLLFDVLDDSYSDGLFGLDVFAGSGSIRNITIDGRPIPPWGI